MGDMGDDFRAMREQDKQRRENNAEKMIRLLDETGIPYKDVGNNTVLIRQGELKVDIYTSKNKWKHGGRFIQGDATGCINWLKKQFKKHGIALNCNEDQKASV